MANAGWPAMPMIWLPSPRLKNNPQPVRTAVLPSPNTSQASPMRGAGAIGVTVNPDCGSPFPSMSTMPGATFGQLEYPPTEQGTNVPTSDGNEVVPVLGSIAICFPAES